MIKSLSEKEFHALYPQMEKDFPENELKSERMIIESARANKSLLLGYYANDVLYGYASALIGKDRSLMLDYFGIVDPYKNQGYGSQFLQDLLIFLKKDYRWVFIEAENNDSELATRRLNFYYRNGMHKTTVDINLYYVDYHILLADLKEHLPEEKTEAELLKLYDDIYGPQFMKRYLKVCPTK